MQEKRLLPLKNEAVLPEPLVMACVKGEMERALGVLVYWLPASTGATSDTGPCRRGRRRMRGR